MILHMRYVTVLLAASVAGLALVPIGCGTAKERTVVVPQRTGETNIVLAYALLHRLGLRVAVLNPSAVSSLHVPIAAHITPVPGARVRVGSTVALTPGFGPLGSPAVANSDPHYRVPNLVGRSLSDAIRWADQHQMYWNVPHLPPLGASSRPELFDGYRVTAQRPGPGHLLGQGRSTSRGYEVTPLTLSVVAA
jgi:hypothetical protein